MFGYLAAGAAALAGLYLWKKSEEKGPDYHGVQRLEYRTPYVVLVQLAGSPTGDPNQISDILKGYFESVGFTIFMKPMPRTADDEAKIMSGNPANTTWIFIARWDRKEPTLQGPANPMIGMASFTPLPIGYLPADFQK